MLMGGKTFDEIDAVSRTRPLTEREAYLLDRYLNRIGERRPDPQKHWTSGDLRRLKRYLERGKKPRQIAPLMGRTERAIWRKIYKEGLQVGKLCPDEVYTPSRLRVRVQSFGGHGGGKVGEA